MFGFGKDNKQAEQDRMKHIKLQFHGIIGPKDALLFLKERYGIDCSRETLEKHLGMGVAKNSTSSEELSSFIYHLVKDDAKARHALLHGGPLITAHGTMQCEGYDKLWHVIPYTD